MESKRLSWRVAYLVTLIQVVILNSYYGACMVSDLLQPPSHTIKSVQDLTNSKLEAGYMTNPINQVLFEAQKRQSRLNIEKTLLSELGSGKTFEDDIIETFDMKNRKIELTYKNESPMDPMVTELYEKKLKKHPENSLRLALDKVRYENFAICDEAIALYPDMERDFSNEEKCSLVEIQLFPTIMTYSVIRRGSPYREMFAYGFLKLMERGVLKRELLYWRPPAPRCQYLDRPRSINMKHISIACFIFIVGVVLAAAIYFCERLLVLHSFKFYTELRYWRKKRAYSS